MLAKGNEQPAASKNGTEDSGVELSKEEAEVYDRQIRVWGFEAQQKWEAFMSLSKNARSEHFFRLHAASGLLCGLSGVGAEIAKNLMLCGLRSLTLMDGQTVVEDDLESNFLLERDSVGQNVGCYGSTCYLFLFNFFSACESLIGESSGTQPNG